MCSSSFDPPQVARRRGLGRALVALFPILSFVLVVVAMGACSSSSSVTPDAGPASGVLRVVVTGLPEGQTAFVVVSAPGVEHKLTASADVALAPGTYSVFAAAVADVTKQDGTGYAPDQTTRTVTLPPDAGATVQVSYGQVLPKIAPETKVASPDTTSALSTVTRDASGAGTLTFSHATAETSSWQVGDLIVLPKSASAPHGFYGRVATTDGTTVTTSPASLQEMIQEGVIDFSRTFTPADITKITALDAGLADVRVCNSLTATLPAQKGVAGLALTVGGELCFAPTMDLHTHFSLKHLPDVYFKVGANVTGSLDVTGAATIGIGVEIPIFEIELGTFDVQLGPVPLEITPELSISVGANGQVTAGVTAGITSSLDAYGGFAFDGASKSFSPFSGHSESFDVQWPEPVATAQLKGYGGPQLTLLVYDVAGPFINLEGYIEYDVDFLHDPLWVLHAGFDLSAGISTSKLLDLQYSVPLYSYDKILAQSTDTPPVAAKTGGVKTAQSNANLALGPNDTVYVATNNDIQAVKAVGPPVWTYTGTGFMENVVCAADGTIFASDFNGGVYALTSAGAPKWTTSLQYARSLATPAADKLYFTAGGLVASLDTTNGNVKWSTPVGPTAWSVSVGKDGTLYAPTESALVALDPAAGTPKWSTPIPQTATSGAAIAGDGTVYVSVYDGDVKIVAVRPDGSVKWKRHALWSDQPSSPVVGPDGTVYVCGTNPDQSLVALDAAAGDMKWRYALYENCEGPPAIGADGNLYLMTGNALRAVRASDGAVQWSKPAAGASGTPTGSPLFLSTGHVAAVNSGGLVFYYAGSSLAASGWPRFGGEGSSAGVAQ